MKFFFFYKGIMKTIVFAALSKNQNNLLFPSCMVFDGLGHFGMFSLLYI